MITFFSFLSFTYSSSNAILDFSPFLGDGDTITGPNDELYKFLNTSRISIDEDIIITIRLDRIYKNVLPNCFTRLRKLVIVEMTHNGLYALPEDFEKLDMLIGLDISNNSFRTFPESLLKLKNLELLDISNNFLTELPSSLAEATKLYDLSVSNNHLESICDIRLCKRLQIVEFSSNVKIFDKAVVSKENRNKYFEFLEKNDAETYDLSEMSIEELPENFTALALKNLGLENNKLTCLPENLNLPSLREINLKDNKLKGIPEVLAKSTELSMLALDDNEIEEILVLDGKSFKNLSQLSLRNNRITRLDTKGVLPKLKTLFLSNNPITDLTDIIFNCKNLEVLDVSSNNLENIPREIKNCSKLMRLVLKKFSIDALKYGVKFPKSLKVLAISNFKNKLPIKRAFFKSYETLTELTQLEFSANTLDFFPEEFTKLVNLEMLNLSYNKIAEIPIGVLNLQRLKLLDLSNNVIEEVIPGICNLPNLKIFGVAQNKIRYMPEEMKPGLKIHLNGNDLALFTDEHGKGVMDLSLSQTYQISMDTKLIPDISIDSIYKLLDKGKYGWRLNKLVQIKMEQLPNHSCSPNKLFEIFQNSFKPHIESQSQIKNVENFIKSLEDDKENETNRCPEKVKQMGYVKKSIIDYTEAIFMLLVEKVKRNDFSSIPTILAYIHSDLGVYSAEQLFCLISAYDTLKQEINEKEDITMTISTMLALLKEDALKEVTFAEFDDKNIHVFEGWKYELADILGVRAIGLTRCTYRPNVLLSSRAYILYAFFKKFTVDNVKKELLESINAYQSAVSAAIHYIHEKVQDEDERARYVVLGGDCNPLQFSGITLEAIAYILGEMELINKITR